MGAAKVISALALCGALLLLIAHGPSHSSRHPGAVQRTEGLVERPPIADRWRRPDVGAGRGRLSADAHGEPSLIRGSRSVRIGVQKTLAAGAAGVKLKPELSGVEALKSGPIAEKAQLIIGRRLLAVEGWERPSSKEKRAIQVAPAGSKHGSRKSAAIETTSTGVEELASWAEVVLRSRPGQELDSGDGDTEEYFQLLAELHLDVQPLPLSTTPRDKDKPKAVKGRPITVVQRLQAAVGPMPFLLITGLLGATLLLSIIASMYFWFVDSVWRLPSSSADSREDTSTPLLRASVFTKTASPEQGSIQQGKPKKGRPVRNQKCRLKCCNVYVLMPTIEEER